MSLPSCLPGLVAEGKIAPEHAEEAAVLYRELEADYSRELGPEAAAALASTATLDAMERQALRRRLLAAQTIRTRRRMAGELLGYNGGGNGSGGGDGSGGGPIDPRAGPAFLGGDGRASYSNVEGRMRAIRGRAHGLIDGLLAKHSTNLLGQVRKPAELADLVRERFGEDSGNASAREFADAFGQAAEMLRQRFNAAGGDIGKLERWGLPQSHDPRLVRQAGYDAWRAEIAPRLDRAAMIDERTGRAFTEDGLENALREVFETIRSDGWSKREPTQVGQGSLANRRGDARFLVFKSADDWMAYADRFGAGSAFDAMMGHIDGMSRDVAMLEILGPNPEATLRWLKGTIEKSAAEDAAPDSKGIDRAHAATRQMDRLYDEITGASNRPENRTLALGFSALRSYQVATKLGGALLSAVSDTAFQFSTRKYNGLPAAGMLRDYAKLMKPGTADRQLAVRLGLIAEEWSNRTGAQGRYLGEELTGEVSRRLAEGVLRASGLSRFTQAGRWAFGMEFLGTLTDHRGKGLGELDPALQRTFARYGISDGDWDKIRVTPVELDRGVPWIKPANVEDRALGDRLLEMIAREVDHAVPMPDLRTRAMLNSVAPKGTIHGELIKSAFLFKSFGVSVMVMQARRIMEQTATAGAKYAGGLVIGSTLMGGLTLMLKDVAAGRDPREATTPEFWAAATLQGGGFGIFGDFLRSSASRAGGGIAGTLAGPIVGDAQNLAAIATAKNREGAAFKFARSQLPGGTLWYARLGFDRMVADQIQEAIDPNYRKSWSRMRQWAGEQGTQFYWAPGQAAPARAPDFSNITEGSAP